jgi:hypothetical protein
MLDRLFRTSYPTREIRLTEIVAMLAHSTLGYSQIDAESYAESNKRAIWSQIVVRLDEESRKGLYPTFEIIDANRFELAWFPRPKRNDDIRVVDKKQRLACRGEILDFIDSKKNVNARAYEAIGCVIARLAGATQWHLTPSSNDFGIDFLALLPAFSSGHLFPHVNKHVRIVGQSKKWSDPIERDQVDLLANRMEDIRRRNSRVVEALPLWFITAQSPLVGCMLAHSGARSGAHDIANDHGIIMADSRDVAEMIVLNRKWKTELGAKASLDLLKNLTNEVLAMNYSP